MTGSEANSTARTAPEEWPMMVSFRDEDGMVVVRVMNRRAVVGGA